MPFGVLQSKLIKMEDELIKSIPLSVEGFRMDIEKHIYTHDNSWTMSGTLKHDDYQWSLFTQTMSCSWPDEFDSPNEEQAIQECERYLTNRGTFEEAVDKTVQWWADKSFNTALNQNNGDNSSAGGFLFALMNMSSMNAQSQATPDKIEMFKDSLKKQMLEGEVYQLSVDYHPVKELSIACKESGLSEQALPIKSHSSIDKFTNVPFGSFGYRGDREML